MKVSTVILTALVSLASAMPAPAAVDEAQVQELQELEARQFTTTRDEVERGSSASCPKAVFIFARGSTEIGNMGSTVGPRVARGLEAQYGSRGVWIQGVGGPYTATTSTNFLPEGASSMAINEMIRLIEMAANKCPSAKITVGGYSQGAALTAGAVRRLSSAVADKVVGAVLFGYTKNQQYGGRIPDFPTDKTKIFCATGDLVCRGSLVITAAHLSYGSDASGEAPRWLISKIGN